MARNSTTLGRFSVVRFLGRGTYGEVWKVSDPLRPGEELALKVLSLAGETDEQDSALEFRIGRSVRHASVLDILEAGTISVPPEEPGPPAGRRVYLLSRFASGAPLAPSWTAGDLLPVAVDLLSALDTIHAAGYRHGDIQPRNVLVDRVGGRPEVCLLDFGLASSTDSGGPRHASSAGTPRYLSPEALRGDSPDHRSDLYAAGLLLYECLRGANPRPLAEQFLRTRQGKFFAQVCEDELPPPWDRLLRRILDPEPASRLQSGAEGISFLSGTADDGLSPRSLPPTFESALPVGVDEFLSGMDQVFRAGGHGGASSGIVLIQGASGSGKSRLLAEAELRAFAAGLRGLRWPSVVAQLEADPDANSAAVEADLEAVSGLGGGGAVQSMVAQQIRAKAVRILETECQGSTSILVDDTDLLPSDQQALLYGLLEAARTRWRRDGRAAPRLVIVLTISQTDSRSGLSKTPLWGDLANEPDVYSYSTRPWSATESAQFVGEVLPPTHELRSWVEILRKELGGHPASYRQALQELYLSGALRLKEGSWTCSRSTSRGLPGLPGDRELFAAEWDGLDPRTQDILGVCAQTAPASRAVQQTTIASACDLSRPELRRHLDALGRVERLRPEAGPGGGHGGGVILTRRQRLAVRRLAGLSARRRFRSLLARAPGLSPAERTYHQLRLGPLAVDSVLHSAADEGPVARLLLSYHAEVAPHVSPDARCLSSRRLAEILYARGELRRSGSLLRVTAGCVDDPEKIAAVALRRAEVELFQGNAAAAEELLQTVDTSRDSGLDARWRFAVSLCRYLLGDLDSAAEAVQEALREHPGFSSLENLSATIALSRGDEMRAEKILTAALARAESGKQTVKVAVLKTNYGRLLLRRGEAERAVVLHRQAALGFEAAGLGAQAARTFGNLSVALRRAGDYGGAAEAGARSLDLHRELSNPEGVAIALAAQGILASELGLAGTARRQLDAAVRTAPADSRIVENAAFLENRALVALALGERDVVEGCVAKWQAARVGPSTPRSEALLLEWRLWVDGCGADRASADGDRGSLDSVRARLEARPMTGSDAGALYSMVRASRRRGGEVAALARLGVLAEGRLAELAKESSAAAVFQAALAAEFTGDRAARHQALVQLDAIVAKVLPRDWRVSVLTILAQHTSDDAARHRAQARLRLLLDEMIADVPSEFREYYRQRSEIKEALHVSAQAESSRPTDRKAKLALQRVLAFSQEILAESGLEQLFRKIVDAAISLTQAQRGVLVLQRHGQLNVLAARANGADVTDPETQMSRTILERTLTEGVARISTDASEDLDLRSIASVDQLGLRSVLCVPLSVQRPRLLAVLYLDNAFERGVFESDDLELAESFCAQAALAWEASERRGKTAHLVEELREANQRLESELHASRRESSRRARRTRKEFEGIVGDSAAIRGVFHLVDAVAPTDIPVLITGESGTGKELVARAIHRLSARASQPFVAENCAAVPGSLLESSLFGYVKGAFTGADRDTRGLFELANDGTLFLDEIGELTPELQASLLRVLQEGEIRPLGASQPIHVDVRIVAATNRDVHVAIREKRFREDLYYRLQGAEIQVPPLRERSEDVPLLVAHLLKAVATVSESKTVSVDALERLRNYPWPGNVRELENEVRRMALLSSGSIIGSEYLSPPIRDGEYQATSRPAMNHVRPLKIVEQEAILHAMETFNGHRGKVTTALGISRSTLYLKLKKLGYEA
jgi:transcriptional regulator with GAF, ATPase, and Fis domain/Tfp pilus assembly protein PilF